MPAKKHNLEFGRYDLRLYWFVLLIHGPNFGTIQHIHISQRRDAQSLKAEDGDHYYYGRTHALERFTVAYV
jgi:hypothetical protein